MGKRRGPQHQGPRLPEYFSAGSAKTLKKVNVASPSPLTFAQLDALLRPQRVLADATRGRLRRLLAATPSAPAPEEVLAALDFALKRYLSSAPNEEWPRKYQPRFAEESDAGLRATTEELMLRISEFFFGAAKQPIALAESVALVEAFARSYHFEVFKVNMLEHRRLQDVLSMLKKAPTNMDIKINLRHCSQPPVLIQINAPVQGDISIQCGAAPRRRSQRRLDSPAALKKLYLVAHLDSFCELNCAAPGLAEQLRSLMSLARQSRFPFVFVLPARPRSPLLRALEEGFARVEARRGAPGSLEAKVAAVAFVEGNLGRARPWAPAAVLKLRWSALVSGANALLLEASTLRVPVAEKVRELCCRFGHREEKVLANAWLSLPALLGESPLPVEGKGASV